MLVLFRVVEISIDLLNIQTRTGFGDVREVAMTDNLGLRKRLLEVFQQEIEFRLLGGCSCIGRSAFFVEAALVAYSNGMFVIVTHMSSGVAFIATRIDFAIAIYVPVVTDHLPTTSAVPAVNVVASNAL